MFAGAVAGQSVFESTEIFETELLSAGSVTTRFAPPGKVIVCKAETDASMVPAADAVSSRLRSLAASRAPA